MFKHVKNLPTSNRTTREKVVASRSDCEHGSREFVVGGGASLHVMSKNELPVKKIPPEDRKNPSSSRQPTERQGLRKKRQST